MQEDHVVVSVDLRSVRRAVRAGDGTESWISIVGDALSSVSELEGFIQETDDALVASTNTTRCAFVGTNRGQVVLQLAYGRHPSDLEAWVNQFTVSLEARMPEVDLEIRGLRSAQYPRKIGNWAVPRQWTLFVSLRQDRSHPAAFWTAAQNATSELLAVAEEWIGAQPGRLLATVGTFRFWSGDAGIADCLQSALAQGVPGQVAVCDESDVWRVVSISRFGRALFQVLDGTDPTEFMYEELRGVGDRIARRAEFACLRAAGALANDWGLLVGSLPAPQLEEWELTDRPWLDAHYVPDVSRVQWIGSSHRAKAADLSGWSVEPNGSSMARVEVSRDEGWSDPHEGPVERSLDDARRQFGHMILTSERLQELGGPGR